MKNIFKKIKSVLKYPEINVVEYNEILFFQKEFGYKSTIKNYMSIIGKASQVLTPGITSGDYPSVHIYDHYGLVLNEKLNNGQIIGIEVYYAPFRDIKFEPDDPFKGKLSIFNKSILPYYKPKDIEDSFSDFVLERFDGKSVLDVGPTQFEFRFDDDDIIRVVKIKLESYS